MSGNDSSAQNNWKGAWWHTIFTDRSGNSLCLSLSLNLFVCLSVHLIYLFIGYFSGNLEIIFIEQLGILDFYYLGILLFYLELI